MHEQRVGYIRVSSFDQNPERQLDGVSVDRVFTDKASGKDTRRPELDNLLAFVREGDTLVVDCMDRLARNLDYTMHLAPTLFGGWDLVREWGRSGSPGTLRINPFETLEESERALRRVDKQKRKRGYL